MAIPSNNPNKKTAARQCPRKPLIPLACHYPLGMYAAVYPALKAKFFQQHLLVTEEGLSPPPKKSVLLRMPL
ncbi:hypothetical protein [Chitinimonas sp. JJ19]|uniref:hypothetical protein n=1 Tax=Chitinimonas sp. JJ19 TaxID=3109352 RepID=UPI003002FB5E